MDVIAFIVGLAVVGAVLRGIFRLIFPFWFARTVWKAGREAQRYYNAQLEYQLRQIAIAQQQQQIAQAQLLADAARQQITSLPRPERRVYRRKLSDVVHRKLKLNKFTREWEEVT